MENSFNKKIRSDGKKELNNPDAYQGYKLGKDSKLSSPNIPVDISAEDNYTPRKRIIRSNSEKVWDGQHAAKVPEYGTRKFADIENPKDTPEEYPLVKGANKDPRYKNMSDEALEGLFHQARERQKSDVIMKNHEFEGKQDYRSSYRRISKEMLRRGLLEEARNAQIPSREEFRAETDRFADGIVAAIEEKQEQEMHEFRESLGQNDSEFLEFESDAQSKFQAMNAISRNQGKESDAYFEAHKQWMNARARVEAHEASYRESQEQSQG